MYTSQDSTENTLKSLEKPEKEVTTKILIKIKWTPQFSYHQVTPTYVPRENKTDMTDKLVPLNLTPPPQEEELLLAPPPVLQHLGCLLPANGQAP